MKREYMIPRLKSSRDFHDTEFTTRPIVKSRSYLSKLASIFSVKKPSSNNEPVSIKKIEVIQSSSLLSPAQIASNVETGKKIPYNRNIIEKNEFHDSFTIDDIIEEYQSIPFERSSYKPNKIESHRNLPAAQVSRPNDKNTSEKDWLDDISENKVCCTIDNINFDDCNLSHSTSIRDSSFEITGGQYEEFSSLMDANIQIFKKREAVGLSLVSRPTSPVLQCDVSPSPKPKFGAADTLNVTLGTIDDLPFEGLETTNYSKSGSKNDSVSPFVMDNERNIMLKQKHEIDHLRNLLHKEKMMNEYLLTSMNQRPFDPCSQLQKTTDEFKPIELSQPQNTDNDSKHLLPPFQANNNNHSFMVDPKRKITASRSLSQLSQKTAQPARKHGNRGTNFPRTPTICEAYDSPSFSLFPETMSVYSEYDIEFWREGAYYELNKRMLISHDKSESNESLMMTSNSATSVHSHLTTPESVSTIAFAKPTAPIGSFKAAQVF